MELARYVPYHSSDKHPDLSVPIRNTNTNPALPDPVSSRLFHSPPMRQCHFRPILQACPWLLIFWNIACSILAVRQAHSWVGREKREVDFLQVSWERK